VRVGAGREPAHAGHGHLVARVSAELAHPRDAGVDLVDVEVRARALLAGLHVRDRRALALAEPGHVVLARPREVLELEPKEPAPERAGLLGVVGWNLDVDDLSGHPASSRVGYVVDP